MKSGLFLAVLLTLLVHASSFRTDARAALSFSRPTPISFYQKAANHFANLKPLKIAQKQEAVGQFGLTPPPRFPSRSDLMPKSPVAPFAGFRFQQQQQQVQQAVQQQSREDGFGAAFPSSLMGMAAFGNGGVLAGFDWSSFQNPYPQPGVTGMAGNILNPLNAMAAAAIDSQSGLMTNAPSPMMPGMSPPGMDSESATGAQQINTLFPNFFLGGVVKEPYGWEHSSDPHEHYSDGTPYLVHLSKYDKWAEVKKA